MSKFERITATIAAIMLTIVVTQMIALGSALGQMNVEGIGNINEDEVIVCVSGQLANPEVDGLICHLTPADNLDWYQEIDNPRDYLANTKDSFSVTLTD